MCFRFESCFGVHVHDDDDYHYGPSHASKAVQPRHATDVATTEPTRDGGYYGSSNGHRAQQQGLHRGNAGHHTAAYRHQQPAAHADDEAGGRRKQPSPALAGAREQAHTAGAAFKCPAPAPAGNGEVAHGAANGARYHHYPAPAATSDHGRY